jgi:gamma-tubulin complex component 2
LQGARFVIDPSVDASLRDLVERIVPLATYYSSIDAFVEFHSHLSHGLVAHALSSAIRDMLREYLVLVAQLEHQFMTSISFTLQRFWFYVHPTLRTLQLIHSLTADITAPMSAGDDSTDSSSEEDEAVKAVLDDMKPATGGPVKGGEILAVVHERLDRMSGDPIASKLYSTLLLRASQPYATMIFRWIGTGSLIDPFDEFIVRQSKSIARGSLETDYIDEVWEKMYTLRDAPLAKAGSVPVVVATGGRKGARERGLGGGAILPSFLEAWKTRILLAGKYLNVIRECGIEVQVPEATEAAGNDELIAMDQPAWVIPLKA